MELRQEHQKQIEEVMSEVNCQKGFECCKAGFRDICRVKDVGPEDFLKCLEENSQDCQFSLSFGNGASCLCPVRIHIATELHR